MEPTTIAALVAVSLILLWNLNFLASLLNLKALDPKVPEEFVGVYDEDQYAKSQAYTAAGTKFDILQSLIPLLILLAFWFSGGFGALDTWARGLGFGPTVTGLIYIGVLYLASLVLGLPASLYETFVLEERFGFNKTTPATFVKDLLISLLLSAVIGVPLLAGLFWIFSNVPQAWLWAWLFFAAFQLALTYFAPSLILPLFNKFNPMPEGELKDAIFACAKKCNFPLTELFIVDGSKRSAKSNAYFTGFGKKKRIALFDTLIESQSTDELVGVLAHEIGHFQCKHIVKRLVTMTLMSGVFFFLIGLLTNPNSSAAQLIFEAFKVDEVSIYVGLVLFSILMKPVSRIIGIISSARSRKDEFEADAYAASAQGTPEYLISALKKLSVHNLSNLTPHPLRVFLDHSHPPTLQRIDALRSLQG